VLDASHLLHLSLPLPLLVLLPGKTMLAKAVAHHTTAAFIRVVGSEFVQKYLGEVWEAADGSSSSMQNSNVAVFPTAAAAIAGCQHLVGNVTMGLTAMLVLPPCCEDAGKL
jgi:AAA+ superfamily predicted ATPase